MLIIVESPAKAKTISQIVGKKHTVKASVGHIRRISDDKKTKDGRKLEINGIDIQNNFTPIFEVDKGKKKVVAELRKLAKVAKDGILFATDSDREGEAISWHLAEVLGVKNSEKIKRLEFHEITKSAIDKAMADPRSLDVSLVTAQKARQVLDKLVGYKVSPVLWKAVGNYHLSAGRVQSPALRLVCEREKEILAFKPEEFWEVEGDFISQSVDLKENTIKSDEDRYTVQPKNGQYLTFTKFEGKKIQKIENQKDLELKTKNLKSENQFVVESVTQKTEYARTKPPFTTSTLQQSASSKLGFTPKMTMGLAQKLYEGISINGKQEGLITYMRTDSLNLSPESIADARKFISSAYPESLPAKAQFYKSKSKGAQEAHEAIRPTSPLRTPESIQQFLEPRLFKLYDLIWKRMIASQMNPEERVRFQFNLVNKPKDEFSGSIAWTVKPGFKVLYPELITKKQEIKIKQGETMFLKDVYYIQKFTKPPSRYSPASLIKKLEELGIGRPSTYASIISTLNDRAYVESQGSSMTPTSLGMRVNDLLIENLEIVTSSQLTAQMENNLDEIADNKKNYEEILSKFWTDLKQKVEGIQIDDQSRQKYRQSETDVIDPKYGDKMVLKMGRFGEYYQNPKHPEVMYPKNFREYGAAVEKYTEEYKDLAKGKKCAECGKDLIIRVSKSKLKPYIACPDYKVGNKHTVESIKKAQEKNTKTTKKS